MAIQEGVTLGGLNVNPASGSFAVEAIDFPPPKKKLEWAQSVDSDGADLIREPKYENRTIPVTVRIQPQASMDLALAKLGELVDVIQEAEKNPGGIPLEWTPATGSKTLTFYVLTGEVVSVPILVQGDGMGWFVYSPQVKIVLTAKPYGYAPEVEAAAAKSIETGLSIVTLTIPTVSGDVPAEGRLVITDTAAVGRRFVEWGLENRYYNPATSLILDSEDMVPVGGAQSTALNALGAYKRAGATKGTIATTLLPEPTICCTTGNLGHVGTFRVKLRMEAAVGGEGLASNVHVRLSWQDGEGPFRPNEWQTPVLAGKLVAVDLGIITISPAVAGTQKWLGRIEAYSDNGVAVDMHHVDLLAFIPVLEGYGKARGVQSTAPGTIAAFDNFTTGTLSGGLNARTPPVGSAWATSGATTDFTVASGEVKREPATQAAPRYAVIGSAVGNSIVAGAGAVVKRTETDERLIGLIARWVSEESYAFALCEFQKDNVVQVQLGVKISGTTTILATSNVKVSGTTVEFALSLTALLDGSLCVSGTVDSQPVSLSSSSSAVATGGSLASGKGGMLDRAIKFVEAHARFTRIQVATLAAVPYVVQPSQSMEVRSNATIAEDATGTYSGPVPLYRGSRFFVPQDGSANRTSRVIVKADRNDLEESDQLTIGDAFTAQVFVTPRFHVIPR